MTQPAPETQKSPLVASALSAFLPGAGQIYAERTLRGASVMVATIALTPVYVGLAIWLWQVVDAAACARRDDAASPDRPS